MPIGVRNKIDSIRNSFLWGNNKLHLTSWQDVTLQKKHGGLGITNLDHRNLAMLGKVWWRILENKPSSLWTRLLKDKYGEDQFGWTTHSDNKPKSTLITNLTFLKNHRVTSSLFVRKNYIWKAGRGDRVLFWEDIWVRDTPLKSIYPRLYRISKHRRQT